MYDVDRTGDTAAWPVLDDESALALLFRGENHASEVGGLLGNLEPLLTVRGRATVVLALQLRRDYLLPLVGAIAAARDLTSLENPETCEAVVSLACTGWHSDVWELLAAARAI